jgi:uncharacterized protein (DUF885 family)
MDTQNLATKQLQSLLTDEWERRLRFNPLFATETGDHRYNDLLPAFSESNMEAWIGQLSGFLGRLRLIDRQALSSPDRLNCDLFKRLLENELGMLEFRSYRMPVSNSGGFHILFPDLPVMSPFFTLQDYENYLSRLDAFPQYVTAYIDVMQAGLSQGQVPPRVTLAGVADQLRSQMVADPTASPLFQPFINFPENIPSSTRPRLAEAGASAIRSSIVPGFARLLDFVENVYLPSSRESIAARELPDGEAYYQHCIRNFTTLELTAAEIHRLGLEEVRRIRSEMETLIRETGFQGSFSAFIEFLRSDPRFYVDTAAELLKETALVLKKMDGELPRLFKTLPRLPYGIRQVPDFAAQGSTSAYYQPGSGDGSRAGVYYVNTYDLKSRPLYEIEALSLHEAAPGHHLQIALQQELYLPNFRRFGSFEAFIEGWALYSERLGLEVGFYQDPYSNFGRLSYEMWRACRLVVDTGMHALGWTRQQAIIHLAENTSSTLLNITNEIDRYIAWPGQALAYKIGELKIVELRRKAQQHLGLRFDLREFHEVILKGGALPLDILEQEVTAYLQE